MRMAAIEDSNVPFVRQETLGREKGDVDEEPAGGLLRRRTDQTSGGRIELPPQCEDRVCILLHPPQLHAQKCRVRHYGQARQSLCQLPGQNEAGRAPIQENRLLWLNFAQGSASNLLFLCPMDGQPLLDGRFVEMFGGMSRLHAAKGLDDFTPPDQLVDVAADRHLGDGQQSRQVLVQAGPDRIQVLDDCSLAFYGVHGLPGVMTAVTITQPGVICQHFP